MMIELEGRLLISHSKVQIIQLCSFACKVVPESVDHIEQNESVFGDQLSLRNTCDDSGLPYPLLDNVQVMVIVWRLRGNTIRTAPCWVV